MTDYLQEANTTKNQEDFLNRIAKAANRPRHTLAEEFMLISMLLNQPILATLLMILSKKKRLKV